ncbi:MAG: helix-turn-helix transcriptional regulator [Blastocatellales bacterium]
MSLTWRAMRAELPRSLRHSFWKYSRPSSHAIWFLKAHRPRIGRTTPAQILETKKLTKSGPASYHHNVSAAAVENILKQSRSAILDLLKVNGAMSIEQLAGELEVSKVCVRRHLSLLESDGLVAFEEKRHERGRPRFIYCLTEKARCLFPQIYDEFAIEVLAQLQRNFGDEALQRVFRARADELIRQFGEKLKGRNFDERVKNLVKAINAKGYLADARRMKDGSYRLRQRNCPTESVAVAYSQVCEEELRIYREALGCEVVRECRIADGERKCEFRIAAPALTQISRETSSKRK